jgi:hypothetical protein
MTKSAKLPKLLKSLMPALLVASALAAPMIASAQDSNAPVTRAEVRAQLTQLEKAGYSPAANDNYYPQALQQAQQRVDASNETAAQAYGPSTSGTSASGLHVPVAPASGDNQHSIYFGH